MSFEFQINSDEQHSEHLKFQIIISIAEEWSIFVGLNAAIT